MKKLRSIEDSRRTWVCYAVCLIAAALIGPVQNRLESRTGESGPDPDLLFFSSPPVVKKMALGYENLLADLYWMRAIQYYGRRAEADKRPVRYKNLSTLLDIATTLDPYPLDIYRAGGNFLAEPDPIGAGQPQEALKLLDKGIRAHPGEWKLRFDKGFVYFIYLKDFKAAGKVWLEAGELPGSPPWMKSLAAVSLSKGGAMETARALWNHQYRESTRADVRENARQHLLSMQVAEDLWTLEFLLEKYHEKTGAYPRNLEELVQEKPQRYNTADPLGVPYQYNPNTGRVRLNPESEIRNQESLAAYKEAFRSKLNP
jgi:hypothetical protein